MHVLSTVAERMHVGSAVYSRPYALTLREFLTLMDRDRIARIVAQGDRVGDAGLTAIAFHEPEKLRAEYERVADLAGTRPTTEEAKADAESIVAAMAAHDAAMAAQRGR